MRDGGPVEAKRYGGDKPRPTYHEAHQDWDVTRRVILTHGHTQVDYGACRILYRYPFWQNETQRLTYMAAVENHPKRSDEVPSDYLRRISSIVQEKFAAHPEALREMPSVRMTRRQRDAELQKLRVQAARAVLGERDGSES
jgi:hypothetical protein